MVTLLTEDRDRPIVVAEKEPVYFSSERQFETRQRELRLRDAKLPSLLVTNTPGMA